MPVAVPSTAKPTKSISLREATRAPVTVKTITPSQSRVAVAVSNIARILYLKSRTWLSARGRSSHSRCTITSGWEVFTTTVVPRGTRP